MTTQDAHQFLACLLQTAEVLNTTLSPQKQAGYWLALQDLPREAFEAACIAVMRQEAFFPAPCVFREHATSWRLHQRTIASEHVSEAALLALREALVPQDEVQALLAGVWKDWPG